MTEEGRSNPHPVGLRRAEKACRLNCDCSPGGRPPIFPALKSRPACQTESQVLAATSLSSLFDYTEIGCVMTAVTAGFIASVKIKAHTANSA